MSENTSRFNNESEQMPLDATEASDFLAHSITSRLQRMTLSPWLQRALQSDSDTGNEGGGGILGRFGRRTAVSTQHTLTMLNRMEQSSDRSIVWHADVGSIEPAIEGFTDKIVGRFATTESKYLVQKTEEEEGQPKQGQGPEMVFADYGGAPGTPTTSTTGSPPARRGAFDVNTLPEIPDHIKAQHLANRAASATPSEPISLTPSPKSAANPAKPAAPKRPLTPEERRKMRLYSRVEYVTPGSAAPETPQAHPLAEPSNPESPETASAGAEAATTASPMPQLPPGLTPVSEPVEEPKWRTRPRARVDYLTPRGDSPKNAEESPESAPSPVEDTLVEAASDESLSIASAEAVQRQEEEELTLRPRPRHRETPDSSESEGQLAAPTEDAAPTPPTPVQREEQPAAPTVPSEETVPQAAQPVQPPLAAPKPEQRVQAAPAPDTAPRQSETPSLGPVAPQRESAAPEALDLPLHPRQRHREGQEASSPAEATPSPLPSQVEEPASPSAATPAVQRQAELPAAPEPKPIAAAPKEIEPTAPVEGFRTEERPTLPATPTVQRQAEADQPLDMPLRPRVRPGASSEADVPAPSTSEPISATPESGEMSRPASAQREASPTEQASAPQATQAVEPKQAAVESGPRPAQAVEPKQEAVRPTQQAASVSDEATPRIPEGVQRGTAPQPIQRQAEIEETLDLPLRPRTRPRKAQVEATEAPVATPTSLQPEVGVEKTTQSAPQPAVQAGQKGAAPSTQAEVPVLRQGEPALPPAPPAQRQAEVGTPSTDAPVQHREEVSATRAALPVQRQPETPENLALPLRPRRRVTSQIPTESPATGEQASADESNASSEPVTRAKEAPQVSPSQPTVQRAAVKSAAPTTASQPVEAAQVSQAVSPVAVERVTPATTPVAIERQVEGAFEVPELPLRVRPRFQTSESEEETQGVEERVASQPTTAETPSQPRPVVASAEQSAAIETSETSSTPVPTPVRAQARKSSPAAQKAAQRKVTQGTESAALPKPSSVQRQPTRAQAMPLRPRRRVVATAQGEAEASQPLTEGGTQPSKPMVRRAEVGATAQSSTSQPVRVQRRAQSAKPALPLRARTPQRVIVEEQVGAEEYVAPMSAPNQPISAQPSISLPAEAPSVQRAVESVAATPEIVERPTVAPTRNESVQRAERVERSTEPAPSLPLRAVRRRQADSTEDLAAPPLADELVARLASQSQLPLSGPQSARVQRVAQATDGKAAPKRALPKATRVQREPAKETAKVVAKRARPAIQGYEDATAQLAMAGWRFKRNAGATVSEPGLISRSVDNLVQRSDTGRPLDSGTRATMEGALGRDFSQVRVHNVQLSPLNVQAASEGRNVYFEPGKDRFDTPESLSLLGHELTHVAQAGFAQTKSVVQTAILPQARVQRSEAADEADADQGERSVMEYLRRPQMAQLMPLVNEAPSSSSRSDYGSPSASGDSMATVQRSSLSNSHSDMPVVQRAETGGDGGGSTASATQEESSGGEDGKKDEKDPAEKAKELTKLARQLYPLIKRMLMVERERHSGI